MTTNILRVELRPFILVIAGAVGVVATVHAQRSEPPAASVIVASGEGNVQRRPDCAYITLAVETRAATPGEAQRQNATAAAALDRRITSAGVKKEAVRTLGYNLQRTFEFQNGRQIPRDFSARQAIEVRVESVDRVGELLDAFVEAGATSIDGIRFDLADRPAAEREALRVAVANARSNAEAMAAGAGRSLDRIVRIEHQTTDSPRPFVVARSGVAPAGSEMTPIETGMIDIRAHVVVTASMR